MAVTITSPANGATVTGTITVTASVSGTTNGFSGSTLLVDGAVKGSGDYPITFQLNTTLLPVGTHSIKVQAKIKGVVYTSNTITITVGNVVAASIAQNITGGSTLPASKTWTATLTGINTIKGVMFAVDGVARVVVPVSPYTYVLDTTGIPDGTHTFYVGTTDVNGVDFTNTVTATVSNVTGAAPVNTSPPTISPATYQQGTVLTANKGVWTGSPTPVFTYQWYHCDAAGANCAAIVGYTNPTYTLVADDVGGTVKVRVKAVNASAPAGVTADSAATGVIQASGGGGGTPPSGFHWYETFESGVVPVNFLTEITSFGGNPATISYAFVTDPLGAEGKVARFRCDYDPSQATDYNNTGTRQLVSFYRTAQNSKSGYNAVAEDTWYRCRFMFPTGCLFSSGETNFLHEWHTDNSTQALGGNSSSMYVPCNYPLVQTGVNPTICLRFAAGTPGAATYNFWPSSDGSGNLGTRNGTPVQFNHWYDALFHIIWSKNPAVGKLEWWLDGVLKVSRLQATAYANASLPNGQAYHTFGIYDYRYNISGGASTVYYGLTAAGPTRASVGA